MNICIHIISSRTKTLKESLVSFYKHFNFKHEFPVHVYYFDDIYTPENIFKIQKEISSNIKFYQIDYGIPSNIKFNDIYFVKEKNQSRIGYHHMCRFNSNFYHYPNTNYKKFDIAFNFDDDTLWINDIDINMFESFINSDSVIMSFNVYNYDLHHRSRNVRIGLYELIKSYCKKYNVIPKHKWLINMLEISDEKKAKDYFQSNITCYDTNVIKLEIFKKNEYLNWMKEVNDSNGIYKYRWGDNEIISLFHDLHFDCNVMNVHEIKKQAGGKQHYMDPGGLRHITNMAPSVKHNKQIFDLNINYVS